MHPSVRAWAQLVRVPNTLTACADVLAGFSLSAGAWMQWNGAIPGLILMSLASICLYWAGMILNDVHDLDKDRAQRRTGPLVDGRILIGLAKRTGWGMLVGGVALIAAACLSIPQAGIVQWIVVGIGISLCLSILAYDSPWKGTAVGPFLMGICRALNMLLGVSFGACFIVPTGSDWIAITIAVVGHCCYIVGITLAARREGVLQQSSWRLGIAWSMSVLGVVGIACCSMWSVDRSLRLEPASMYPLLIGLLMLPWLRRVYFSIAKPSVMTLVPAIKQAILSILFLDAAIAMQFAGSIPGILVCGLAIPTMILGRTFRMT